MSGEPRNPQTAPDILTTAARSPLHTLLGEYPNTLALRRGVLTSPILPLTFADVAVPNRAFKRVVRNLDFDVAELALMTFLMARSRDVPLYLLPVVLFSRNPLPHLVCDAGRRRLRPEDLTGCRIGVRTYTTTTAVWIRALLADQYFVDCNAVGWVTLDEGHVAGATDPATVRRAAPGSDLLTMLSDGSLDAAVVDRIPEDGRFVSVVPNPEAVYREWLREHEALTLNHVVAVREPLAHDEPAMRELFRLFRESRHMAGAGVDRSATPIGLEANRRNLEVAIAVASAQQLLARPLAVDELVTDVLASLG